MRSFSFPNSASRIESLDSRATAGLSSLGATSGNPFSNDPSIVSDLYEYTKGGKKIIRKSKKIVRKSKKIVRKSKKAIRKSKKKSFTNP